MAEGGIDRKAEERMEFTTSKEVEIGKADNPRRPVDISYPAILQSHRYI